MRLLVRAKLVVQNEGAQGIEIQIPLDHPSIVGREEACDICLRSSTVSRRHCEFKVKGGVLTIKDLGSRNGTEVNEKRIPVDVRVKLHAGDRLHIGKYIFLLVFEGASKKPVSTPAKVKSAEPPNLASSSESAQPKGAETVVIQGVDLSGWLNEAAALDPASRDWKTFSSGEQLDPVAPGMNTPKTNESQGEAEKALESHSVEPETRDGADTAELTKEQLEEQRLKEIKDKLRGPKAKDSQDAASQALKKLFGRGR